MFCFGQILFNLDCSWQLIMKKSFVHAFFKVSILAISHLITLSLEKEILEKIKEKVWKKS